MWKIVRKASLNTLKAYVTMDFFRFDDKGKIGEHWDAIQKIPSKSKCGNTIY